MTTHADVTQEGAIDRVIDALASCPTPTDLIALMATSPAARNPAQVHALRNRAARLAGVNRPRADRLEMVAAELFRIHACVDTAPSDGSTATLNLWLDEHWYPWMAPFERLLLRCAADARRAGDGERRGQLLRALLTMRRVASFHYGLPWATPERLFDAVAGQSSVPFDDYVAWLLLRGRRGDEGGANALRIREFLLKCRRVSSVVVGEPDADGYAQATRPSTEDEAETWVMADPPFVARCLQRLRGQRADDDWTAIQDELLADRRREPIDDQALVFAETALAEVALWEGDPALTAGALETYRAAVTGDRCARLDPRVRRTHLYHYVYAVARDWRRLPEPVSTMKHAIVLGRDILAAADPSRDPRLIRDTHFSVARLHESLADWDRDEAEHAITHYRAGLAVTALDGERSPKARALSDLANVLHRSGRGTKREVESSYRKALILGPPDEGSWSGVATRVNYAVYLYEQVGTTEAKARALKLLEEAQQVHDRMPGELQLDVRGREMKASILQTTANIRREDGSVAAIEEGLRFYDEAARALGDDPWLRSMHGMILLNRCFACLELHDLTGDRGALLRADMALQEAESCSVDDAARAEVQLCRALVALRAGDRPDQTLEDLDAALAVCRSAGSLVRILSALAFRGGVGIATGTPADLERSIALFLEGFQLARDAELWDETVRHARGAVNALVHAWLSDQQVERLSRARLLLDEVITVLRDRLEDDVILIDGAGVHRLLATASAERAWIRVASGAAVAEVLADVTVAKGTDIVPDAVAIDADLNRLRKEEWEVRRTALRRGKTDSAMTGDIAALRRAAERRALATGTTPGTLATQPVTIDQVRPLTGVIVDVTVCRWGTVVALIPAGEKAPEFFLMPLASGTWSGLVHAWTAEYERIEAVPPDLTAKLLATIGEQLVAGVAARLRNGGHPRVVWIPHVLSGFPLHAATDVTGAPLFEVAAAHVYAPSLTNAPQQPFTSTWQDKEVLCIANDPGGSSALVLACHEVAAVAAQLLDVGARVTVIAGSDGRRGRDAMSYRGVALDDRAECVNPASIGDWLSANLARFDHVLVSSHGVYGQEGGSLALADTVTVIDLLATVDLKASATLHLSACETAMRLGSAYSLASGILHLGARVVVATGWVVREGDALEYSRVLYPALIVGASWEDATVTAAAAVRQRHAQPHRWGAFLTLVRR